MRLGFCLMCFMACAICIGYFSAPPSIESYAQFTREGKIIIDKTLLQEVSSQYPPLVSFLMWVLKQRDLDKWLIPISLEDVVQSARKRAGLEKDALFWWDEKAGERIAGPAGDTSSYNNTYWLKHLAMVVESTEKEAKPYLSPFGRLAIRESLVATLATQLQIVDLIKKHPEILQEKISRPILIIGPPRTMTTHAQSILSEHPDTFYLSLAEGAYPLIPDGVKAHELGTDSDPRYYLSKWLVLPLNLLRPFLASMFRISEKNLGATPQEDIFLTALVFGSPLFNTQTYLPSYEKMWTTQDNRPAFRFMKIAQQVMQWQKRRLFEVSNLPFSPKRWIMKTPEHASFLGSLIDVYPDALMVMTHRDPVPVVESFVPFVTYMAGFWNDALDVSKFALQQLEALQNRLDNLVKQIEHVPKSQLLHIPFREFVKDNWSQVRRICEFADLSLDERSVTLMKKYIAENSRESSNKFEYNISTLGVEFTKESLKRRFAQYTETFQQYL